MSLRDIYASQFKQDAVNLVLERNKSDIERYVRERLRIQDLPVPTFQRKWMYLGPPAPTPTHTLYPFTALVEVRSGDHTAWDADGGVLAKGSYCHLRAVGDHSLVLDVDDNWLLNHCREVKRPEEEYLLRQGVKK
jgi:hypothetical protein